MSENYLKLCLVTHKNNESSSKYQDFILQAVQGGITALQVREKSMTPVELKEFSLLLKSLLAPFNVPLIINDNVALAKEIDADGVHLGQSDASPTAARELLGPDKIIGLSIESLDELKKANQLSCINYIAASAVFQSTSKTDCKKIWGLDGLNEIVQLSKHPVIAIGGINEENIKSVMQQGANGVAVISSLHAQANPLASAQRLIGIINKTMEINENDK